LPTDNDVPGVCVEKLARLLSPGDDPASIRYAVGGPPDVGGFQTNDAVEPLTLIAKRLGGPGTPSGDGPGAPVPTTATTSFDGGLVPPLFPARTRTKYVPVGTCCTVMVVATLSVEKTAKSLPPLNEPASTIYVVGTAPEAAGSHDSVTAEPTMMLVRLTGASSTGGGAGGAGGGAGGAGGADGGGGSPPPPPPPPV